MKLFRPRKSFFNFRKSTKLNKNINKRQTKPKRSQRRQRIKRQHLANRLQ